MVFPKKRSDAGKCEVSIVSHDGTPAETAAIGNYGTECRIKSRFNWWRSVFCISAIILPLAAGANAQTGRIAGTVTEAGTGDELPGVNIVISGTNQGAITDGEGHFSIINVSPGTYVLEVSFIGYATQTQQDVRVNIDQTTTVDVVMQEEAIGLDELVVQAERNVVRRDVSASVANLDASEIENIATTTSVEGVIGLQAGAEGLNIRGGGLNQLAFQVDGMSMRDGRTNTPFTGISFTSIDAVQVQTGGFNAEYGNVRSGLVNIVTKEGARDRYTADVLLQYSPPSQKNFGSNPTDFNGYWTRPWVDPDVAYIGTHHDDSPWDRYDHRSYPRWEGYNAISQAYMGDAGLPNLTPEQVREGWEWFHRKDFTIVEPDYTFDATIGGPIPAVSRSLGDLRFSASFREFQNAYIIPMERDAYNERTAMLKVTSNISQGIKMSLHGMLGSQRGHQAGWGGINQGGFVACCGENSIFSNNKVAISDIDRNMVGVDMTHMLNTNTFYAVHLQRSESDFLTIPGPPRDETIIHQIGEMELDERPFGWYGPYETFLAFTHGGHEMAIQYDTSRAVVWSAKFDITSQLNRYSQLKAGLEYIHTTNEVRYENRSDFIAFVNRRFNWDQYPQQGAAYLQNKLEFQGMVANVGLRLDYFTPGSAWYDFNPFDRALSAAGGGGEGLDENLPRGDQEHQFHLSPRLGVSFPITEFSKLFFNYGHFRQQLNPSNLFLVEQDFTGSVDFLGNPNHPMPNTVAYELGYEHSLFDAYLLRITGYYRALDDQPRSISFVNLDESVRYASSYPFNYEDVRGLEFSVAKTAGEWVRGFANFTYMARKTGNFGFGQQFENRRQQRDYERRSTENILFAPVPEPYARLNLELLSPAEFGPDIGGFRPLGGWSMSWLARWRAGNAFTWTGATGSIPGIQDNIRWRSDYMIDLRLSRSIPTPMGSARLYVDVSNVFNIRHLNQGSFIGSQNFNNYMWSLHISEDTFEGLDQLPYDFIPGNDRPGDVRKEGVEFVPIEIVSNLPEDGYSRTMGRYGPLYYLKDDQSYHVWNADANHWEAADPGQVQQVLDDKAYIEMPNMRSYRFLNPRQIFFGIRISL